MTESAWRVGFVIAGGDGFFVARTSITGITDPVEDVFWGSFINGYAVESMNWIPVFKAVKTAAPPLIVPSPAQVTDSSRLL